MRQLDTDEWIGRSIAAGTAAALLATAFGVLLYTTQPGARIESWWQMMPAVFGFASLCGLFGGPLLAGALRFALDTGGGPRKVGVARLLALGAAGGVAGGAVPVLIGAWCGAPTGLAHVTTSNLFFSALVGGTSFVALWATSLWKPLHAHLSADEHIGVAAIASAIAFVSSAILAGALLSSGGVLRELDLWMASLRELGLVPFAMGASVVLGSWIGAVSGFATWLYLSAVRMMARQL